MEESPAQMKKGTLNLMMFAYSSTNTKTDRKKDFFLSRFMCQVSHLCIMCHVLCVTCHLPQTLPLITPPLCTVGRFANPKNPKNPIAKVIKTAKTQNMSKGMPILAIGSLTRSLQSTGKRGFQMWPDRQMYRSRTLRLIN
jgi:hypothetical protein